MIVKINNNPSIIASTIIAGNAISTIKANAAPINNPIINPKKLDNITHTIPRQVIFLVPVSS